MATHAFGLLVENLDPAAGPANFTITVNGSVTLQGTFANFAGTAEGLACGDQNFAGDNTVQLGGYATHIAWAMYFETDGDTFSGTIQCDGVTQDTTLSWDDDTSAATIPANTGSYPFSFPAAGSSATAEQFAALRRRATSRGR